jgi:hypothetical protein
LHNCYVDQKMIRQFSPVSSVTYRELIQQLS